MRRCAPNAWFACRRPSNALDPVDREIICLRHFEELTAAEAAQVLDIREAAAAKRYVRALRRLKDALVSKQGGLSGS
jgi:RNA polymerase sigma-70 factor (ECF subfamily)